MSWALTACWHHARMPTAMSTMRKHSVARNRIVTTTMEPSIPGSGNCQRRGRPGLQRARSNHRYSRCRSSPSAQKLCAVAVSDLGENADLQLVLDGLHPMNWNGTRWEIAVTQVAEAPPQVTVTGTQGSCIHTGEQTEICLGDLDRDGDVDETDLGPFASAFGTTSSLPHYDAGADLNSDGDVDGGDLAKFAAHMGRSDCPLCP